jgi:hypothetical protein
VHARLLFLCFLVAALYPDVPTPILIVHGVQGSAKSTLLRLIKRLIDPHEVELRGQPKELAEYTLTAWKNRCLAFDNLTFIPQWLSDAMCRTVTGDGLEKRKLYSDDTSVVFKFMRVLLLCGINVVAQNPDLLDRAIIVELEPIPQNQRRPESQFWKEFEHAAPKIFGGMLDTLARALEILPEVRLEEYPRMADFALIGAAVAIALGGTKEEFLTAYSQNTGLQSDVAMESSVVAQALLNLLDERPYWSGSASGLLGELRQRAAELNIDTIHWAWPKSPSALARRLRELVPPLRARGIRIAFGRTSDQRELTISKAGATENRVPGKVRKF